MAREPGHCSHHRPCSTIEQIVSLLDRPSREESHLFWAEGCRSLFSAIENSWPVRRIVYCPKLLRSAHAWQCLKACAYPTLRVSVEEFGQITRREQPDGIGVVCEQRWHRLIDQQPAQDDIWVALDAIRTPGNLGTIMRTCAAVGATGIMLVGGEIDPYDPAAIRASMGALFATKLIRTSAKALGGWKARRQVRFVGTSPASSLDYRELCYESPLVLMMGSERAGLRERQLALCDKVVRLPMTSKVDSLNLAIATSVMLYAIRS